MDIQEERKKQADEKIAASLYQLSAISYHLQGVLKKIHDVEGESVYSKNIIRDELIRREIGRFY